VNGTRPPCQGDSHTPKCKSDCTNSDYTIAYKQDKWFGKTVYTLNKVEQIQMELLENGPIQTSFTVYSDFLNYKSGIVRIIKFKINININKNISFQIFK
jgi:cathepsin B